MKTSKKRSNEFVTNRKRLARFLFYTNAVVWTVIGVLMIVEMLIAKNTISTALVAFFFLINITALFACAKLLEQKEKWVFVVIAVIPILNILLSFTGYPKFLYILTFIIDVLILVTVISLRNYYLD
jgi:hypothetical protein